VARASSGRPTAKSLIHLLRVNVLKRMESAVSSFTLTVHRQLKDVEATLARIEAHAPEIEELDIADVDIDDPAFESLLVGRKVKVLLSDVDLLRWRQDLIADRNRLAACRRPAGRRRPGRQAHGAARRDHPQVPAPQQPGNNKSSSSRPLPIRRSTSTNSWRAGPSRAGPRKRAGHRPRAQPDQPAAAPQGPRLHPDRLLSPLQGAAGRAGPRGRTGSC
jgi:hypothetical protein